MGQIVEPVAPCEAAAAPGSGATAEPYLIEDADPGAELAALRPRGIEQAALRAAITTAEATIAPSEHDLMG